MTKLLGRPGAQIIRVLLLVTLLLSATTRAYAQSEGDGAIQLAKQYFDDGQNLYLQGKFAEAAEKFKLAHQTKAYPAFLFNVAVCYEKQNNFVEALDHYEKFLAIDANSPDAKLVQSRIEKLRELAKSSGAAKTTASAALPAIEPKGLVVIESNPEGAAIYLNDKKSGIMSYAPYTGSLPPGQHTVILEMKEFQSVRKTFYARNDRLTYLYFAMTRQQNLGWIEVKGNIPGADVFFDKREVGAVGKTPYSGNLLPGKRKLIVEKPGYQPHEQIVDIVAGKTHPITVELKPVSFGWLKVTGRTTQGGEVVVDGKPVTCKAYPCNAQLQRGVHQVVVRRDGFKEYETSVTIGQAEEVQLAVRLNPKPSRLNAYITYGVAAALLGGGIAAGLLANGKASDLEQDLTNRRIYDSGDSRFGSGKIMSIVANSLFGLSAVAAGLGTYYLFRNDGPDSYGEQRVNKLTTHNFMIVPELAPGYAAISGQVRF